MDGQLVKSGAMATAVPNRRLQVWHYSSRRRNYEDNIQFSQFLSKQDLKGWAPQAVSPTADEQDSGSKYFPLELDLLFRPPKPSKFLLFKSQPKQPLSDPVSDLVEVFFELLPAIIKKYFKSRPSEPHQLVLFPTNNGLSEVAKYSQTHVLILKSLDVSSTTCTGRAVVPPSDVPAEICRSAMSLAHSASLGADTASIIIAGCENWKWGKSSLDAHKEIRRRWAEADVMREGMTKEGQLTAQDAISRDWTRAEERLGLFMQVMESMKHIVDCISKDSRCAASPQHLYEAMIFARNASIVLSGYQKQMLVVMQQLGALKADAAEQTKLQIHAGIICAAMVLAWFTAGTFLAIGGPGLIGLGVNEIYHQYDASSHKSRIKDVNNTIKELGRALADADAALAITFCSRVLRKPLDSQHMSPQERMAMLRELGVDTHQLEAYDYSQKLIGIKIDRFCKVYKDLMKKTDDLKTATGFETHRRRSGSLIEAS